jgi:nitroreductase
MTMETAETHAVSGEPEKMDVLTAIEARTSAIRLGEPGPTAAQVEQLIRACAAAPDHGRLAPWRFVVISGRGREALGNALAQVRLARVPDATKSLLQSERDKALRAPVIIAVAARLARGGKVPELEQLLAVGAGVQNMFLAAQALGYGAMWKTGEAAYETSVKAAIGLEPEDQIVAFLYLGSPIGAAPPKPRSIEGLVSYLG